MRYLKFFLIILSIVIVTLGSVYFARSIVIKQIANLYLTNLNYSNMNLANESLVNRLNEQPSSVSCLEFDFSPDLTIIIEKLCINSPYADVVINNAIISWKLSVSTVRNSSIDSIDIASMAIVGRKGIDFFNEPADNPNDKKFQISETPKFIKATMESLTQVAISQLSISTSLQIQQFTYQPFIPVNSSNNNNKNNNRLEYQGTLSVGDNKANFKISNDDEVQILSIGLTANHNDFQAKVSTDIVEAVKFLLTHNIHLSPALVTTNQGAHLHDKTLKASVLTANDLKVGFLKGKLSSDLTWQDKKLTINSQLTDSRFITSVSDELSSISLVADLAWETRLVENSLTFDFEESSHLKLLAGKEDLADFLSKNQLSDSLINLVKDNNFTQFVMNPIGLITVDFSAQKMKFDKLRINELSNSNVSNSNVSNNKSDEVKQKGSMPLTLLLSDVELIYEQQNKQTLKAAKDYKATEIVSVAAVSSNTVSATLKQAKFSLETDLLVSALKPFRSQTLSHQLIKNEAVSIQAFGSLSHQDGVWEVLLEPTTKIKLSHLSIPSSKPANEKESQGKGHKLKDSVSTAVKLAELISFWQGKISVDTNAPLNSNSNSNLALESNNQIKNLALSTILQVEEVQLTIEITGNLEDIMINSELITDNVSLSTLNLRGNAYQPHISLSANELSVTDLLALKVNLPVELQLIDGTLSYQLSGQLNNFKKDFSHALNSSMALSLSLESITGEIDGKWLQDINWQQKFIIKNQNVISIPSTSANFSIAKIETATPITDFLMSTEMRYEKGDIQVKVNNVHAKVLGGSFIVENASWPLSKEHSVNVQLDTIDLAQLLELDKKQGIIVTGKISGELPVFTDGKTFLIDNGELYNVGDGVIQVYNNPAVEELKASGTQLKLAFDALENLHYHHLYSKVSMADDGYMLLDTIIKGKNPDLDNDVNLNLNLSYDLLGLLESLNITKQFDNKVIQGLQKN